MAPRAAIRSLTARLTASRVGFAVVLAATMVGLRLLLFDYPNFFLLATRPSHDMSQGAAFFATNLHSIRLFGEPVWWNPISYAGYAQYFQSFLSPLAPTTHHISMIVLGQLALLLGLFDVALAEYPLYLAITYIVLPALAFLTFALLAGEIVPSRFAVVVVVTVYALSGIGLWFSAWLYFQEAFTLNFLLWSCLVALKRPGIRSLLLLSSAVVLQISSLNYWSIHNSWFIVIFLGAYCATHTNQVRRLVVSASRIVGRHHGWAGIVGLACVSTIGLWLVIIGTIAFEQAHAYQRSVAKIDISDVFRELPELRKFTTELFNPSIERALKFYQVQNDIHNARYIGAFLIPFLVLLPFMSWTRRERWLVFVASGVLAVCLASPLLLGFWLITPFMSNDRHLFYYYTHYLQIVVALLAATVIDVVVRRGLSARERRVFVTVTICVLSVVAIIFAGLSVGSSWFPAYDTTLQAILLTLLFVGIPSLGLFQILLRARQSKATFMALVLIVMMTDLTRYFWQVSYIDNAATVNHILKGFTGEGFAVDYPDPSFTQRLWNSRSPIPPAFEASLRQPWPPPDLVHGVNAGLIDNLPMVTTFWPINWYLNHQFVTDVREAPTYFSREALWGRPVELYESALLLEQAQQVSSTFVDAPGPLLNHRILLVQERGQHEVIATVPATPEDADLRLAPYDEATWALSGMERVAGTSASGAVFRPTREPRMTYTGALDACLADYDFLHLRTSAAADVQPRHVVVSYRLDEQAEFSEDRRFGIVLAVDDKEHAYAYDLRRLQGFGPDARLRGLRIETGSAGASPRDGRVAFSDVRLVRNARPAGCRGVPPEAAATAPSVTWEDWRYNDLTFTVRTGRDGWLLIRQLDDPLWRVTVDGSRVEPVRANFAGMAFPLARGEHRVEMRYEPFARRLYWPASLLLEGTLLLLAVLAVRTRGGCSGR